MNPDDIPGWNNGQAFYDLIIETLPPKSKVLEMGVFYGRGLVYLAQNSDFEIYGVDSFIAPSTPYLKDDVKTNEDFYEACMSNLFKFGVQRQVTLIPLNSERASKLFQDQSLDCVFIDGEHSYEPVVQDIGLWRTKVKPGGYLSGDDYGEPWGGVIKAVDELFPERTIVPNWTWYVKL